MRRSEPGPGTRIAGEQVDAGRRRPSARVMLAATREREGSNRRSTEPAGDETMRNRVEYNVASEADPHGSVHTVKREALRTMRSNNQQLRDRAGKTLPPPHEWEPGQNEEYEHLIYDVVASRTTANGDTELGAVDENGQVDW